MVCNRCILVVQQELTKLSIDFQQVTLGEIELKQTLTDEQKETFVNALNSLSFELIDDAKANLIEKIKSIIIQQIHHNNRVLKVNLSDYLSEELHHDYSYLSNLFSEVEGTTIEKYYIAQKIEKVKELLVYDELTLSEIAEQLNYSSVAYLSNQFKKVTGFTPSHFKQIRESKRKPLDEV